MNPTNEELAKIMDGWAELSWRVADSSELCDRSRVAGEESLSIFSEIASRLRSCKCEVKNADE